MIQPIDITDEKQAAQVLSVQIPAYTKEAEWIGFYHIPPLMDTIETLQSCGETFFGYYEKEELCGAVSYKINKDVIDIHRLMVHPKHFRKGIARKLLDFIMAVENQAVKIIVTTGSKNIPAIRFYEQTGFIKTEEFKTAEQLAMTAFVKKL